MATPSPGDFPENSAARREWEQAQRQVIIRQMPLWIGVKDLEDRVLRLRGTLRRSWEYIQWITQFAEVVAHNPNALAESSEQATLLYSAVRAEIERTMPELLEETP